MMNKYKYIEYAFLGDKMAYFILFLKGIIIGLGKIIPGVSGAVIAMSFNIYDNLINELNNLLKFKKVNIKFLLFLGLGIIISIIFGSKLIKLLLNKFYLSTMLLFIGLILGSLPTVIKSVKYDRKNIIYLVISFLLIMLLKFTNISNSLTIDNNFIYLPLGIIESFSMIVPGISGTALYMIIGCYDKVITLFSSLTSINLVIIKQLLLFIVGILVGAIIFIKLISYLLNNHKEKTYYSIIGFILASIIILFMETLNYNYKVIEIIIGLLFLIIGCKLGHKFEAQE